MLIFPNNYIGFRSVFYIEKRAPELFRFKFLGSKYLVKPRDLSGFKELVFASH